MITELEIIIIIYSHLVLNLSLESLCLVLYLSSIVPLMQCPHYFINISSCNISHLVFISPLVPALLSINGAKFCL